MTPPKYNTQIIPLVDHPQGSYERKGIHTYSSIPTLSKTLEGFERGELVAITAPPGNGKTMLARTLCMDMIKQKYKCLYLSYELTYSQLLRMFKLSGLDEFEEKDLILSPMEYSERDITFVEQLADDNDIDVLVVDDIHSLEE